MFHLVNAKDPRFKEILDLLCREWDPIGMKDYNYELSQSEYRGYVDGILRIPNDSDLNGKIYSYLKWSEREHMGLNTNGDREIKNIADQIYKIITR